MNASWSIVSERFNRLSAYRRADSISELAPLIGVDPGNLERSIADYNQGILEGSPDIFGRELRPLPISKPPFYAVEHLGWSIVGFAGLGVDDQLRVIDADGHPIEGLFAAGEVLGLGAMSGNAFTGGMSVTPAMTFGRLLGRHLGASE